MAREYTVIVELDEDGYYVASCPALLGCHSQGKTEEQALANIQEAIEGWLEVEEEKARRRLTPGQHLHQVSPA
ncbi:MAG: type II toxin-antitoxin system HicB family antitoxin [Armatimonadetes bacterium]|nr:type II toxin-antitoxin system HicB family antitoxin [Armatimonadota bacterium]